MALNIVNIINEALTPYKIRVNGINEAAALLESDIDKKIKKIIAPLLIAYLAMRNEDLDTENRNLRSNISKILVSKKERLQKKTISAWNTYAKEAKFLMNAQKVANRSSVVPLIGALLVGWPATIVALANESKTMELQKKWAYLAAKLDLYDKISSMTDNKHRQQLIEEKSREFIFRADEKFHPGAFQILFWEVEA